MKPIIHGWTAGLVLLGAACLGLASPAVSDPPSTDSGGNADSSASERNPQEPRVMWPENGSVPAAPTNRTLAAQSGVVLSRPMYLLPEDVQDARSANSDARPQPIIQSSYQTAPETQSGKSGRSQNAPSEKRPVTQFVRQPAQSRGAQAPPSDRAAQPPGQSQQSGEATSFIGNVDVQELDQPGVLILRGNPQDVESMRALIEKIADQSGVKFSRPTNLLAEGVPDARPAKPDTRVPPAVQSSYQASPETQSGTSGLSQNAPSEKRPVTQFIRQSAQGGGAQAPPSDRAERQPTPPGQPQQSGEVPSFIGNVDVQGLDQLGVLILRGNPQDVESMRALIEKIQEIAAGVEPFVRVFQLQRASAVQVRETILELYAGSTGSTSSTNRTTTGQPATGQSTTPSSAAALQTSVLKRFQMAADDRSNSLIVSASPQMMEELDRLIGRLDVDRAPIVNEVRIFQLKNAEATELTNILTQAISGTGASTSGASGQGAASTVSGGGQLKLADRAAVLKFVPLDGQSRAIESGILDEVRITAQVRTNSVMVSAPSSSMDLIASIIAELDKPPTIVASIKVFQLKNSDATNMRLTLSELFDLESSTTTGGGGGFGGGGGGANATSQFQRPIAVAGGDHPPVSIRVAVDERTNSLIVSGPENSLLTVEAVIKKLDLGDIHNRKIRSYRLKNAQASDVALALTQFFTNKRTIESTQTGAAGQGTIVGAYQRLEQDVVIVALDNTLAATLSTNNPTVNNPNPTTSVNNQGVSNTLLISASPRYYEEVIKMIEELDAPQPQVMIQVVIAQLALNDDFEFGLELGFQSDVLFKRGGATSTIPGMPGFNFNPTPPSDLGNTANVHPSKVGPQGLTNFSLGRANADGLGGMILSAGSDTVNVLLRALQTDERIEILSRPQIMTLDGRTARVIVAESIPYIGTVTQTQIAVTPQVSFINVGVTLTVKPSITPDGRIYLEVVPEVTELEKLVQFDSGTFSQNAPQTTVTAANTVVSVNDGQTIVLGGLIQKRKIDVVRKVPCLGDLPYLGNLFRYTQHQNRRVELLVILTPHIIRNESDAQRIKDVEVERMNWILNDAVALHGDLGLSSAVQNPNTVPCDLGQLSPDSAPTIIAPQTSGIQAVEAATPAANGTKSDYDALPATPQTSFEGPPRQNHDTLLQRLRTRKNRS